MSDPVFFITGASSGFGESISLEARKRNFKVIATARRSAKIAHLKEAGAAVMDLDVTADEATLAAKLEEANSIYGKITHVINAAGYVLEGAIEESSNNEIFDTFNTNVFGAVNITRAALPYLRAQQSSVLAHFGSLASWNGMPGVASYNATKWAVSGLTESLAPELAPFGIRACVIEPGYFRTALLNSGGHRIHSARHIEAYDNTAARNIHGALNQADNKQLGNVDAAARVIIDVFTGTGVGAGREIPVRLVLGSDILAGIKEKMADTDKLLNEWESVIITTDHKD
ncbi:unnamed protein product [Clonostachys rosea]|uniref:Ketoreductase domain-containing protein n=1 Tax=Bionectria ochroleuca TaxID=29856 RepID=A0ABY6TX49_BIOOC|nr:unnamed protein product [Clonostachys rosea]